MYYTALYRGFIIIETLQIGVIGNLINNCTGLESVLV